MAAALCTRKHRHACTDTNKLHTGREINEKASELAHGSRQWPETPPQCACEPATQQARAIKDATAAAPVQNMP
jgi:hypothetical protein